MKPWCSAGGVVYRESSGRIETVLCGRCVHPPGAEMRNEDIPLENVRWSLAKGTPDEGETLEETALEKSGKNRVGS